MLPVSIWPASLSAVAGHTSFYHAQVLVVVVCAYLDIYCVTCDSSLCRYMLFGSGTTATSNLADLSLFGDIPLPAAPVVHMLAFLFGSWVAKFLSMSLVCSLSYCALAIHHGAVRQRCGLVRIALLLVGQPHA